MNQAQPALPPGLSLQPVSRRPLVLHPQTVSWVLEQEVPTGQGRTPEVSIVVVSHENLPITRLCLQALLAEDDGPGFEIIVVDNGSTDLTPIFLEQLESRHTAVRVIKNHQNPGFAAAVNQGLHVAEGDVLVILNNDVIVSPGWLARLVPLLYQDGVGMVGPVTNAAPNEARTPTSYATYAQFLDHAEGCWVEQVDKVFDIGVLTMFCAALRRETFQSVGPLDEQFGLGMFEDDDYARRLRAAGYRLVCAEGVFVHHFGEASFGSLVSTGQHGMLFRRNRRLFERKWDAKWSPHQGRQLPEYDRVVERTRELVAAHVPRHATLVVVSKGDGRLLEHGDRRAWHFPADPKGGYAGHYPADGNAAADQLTELRRSGATHLVFPRTSRWWLEHYAGLQTFLDQCCERIVEDEACTLFQWRDRAPDGF